jgi:hypothetical protein
MARLKNDWIADHKQSVGKLNQCDAKINPQ